MKRIVFWFGVIVTLGLVAFILEAQALTEALQVYRG